GQAGSCLAQAKLARGVNCETASRDSSHGVRGNASPMRRDGWIAGFGRVFSASGRTALGIAIFWTLVTWSRLAAEAWLPWTLQVVMAGVTFFSTLGIAWVLGA